ncbi:MAG: tRNA1(Val) (adenine(37)-N6)-methyltransferase [Chitinophagales bacterium]
MSLFRFKQFAIAQNRCAMKVGTDGVLLGAWANCKQATAILDIGTGTGLIALMLAQRNLLATIDAIDINVAAAEQANENMQASPWTNRLTVFPISLEAFAKKNTKKKYDLIVSNPPFFINSLHSPKSVGRNQARHTDSLPFSDLLLYVNQLLSVNGKFCVILPCQQAIQLEQMSAFYNLFCETKLLIYPKAEKAANRCLMQFSRQKTSDCQLEKLVLRSSTTNQYTTAYRKLTCNFHLMY